jgi:excisionase family DNA binding protein
MTTVTPFTSTHDLPQFVTVRQFCSATGLSRNTVYAAIRSGQLPSVRFSDRKIFIPREAIVRTVEQALQHRIEVDDEA